MGLLRYSIRRISEMVPLFFLIIVFIFILIRLAPSDPATILAGELADDEYRELIFKKYGLDKPIHEQLLSYITAILRGDLGYSFRYKINVSDLVLARAWNTVLLMIGASAIYVPLGIGLGMASSWKPGSKADRIFASLAVAGYSIPVWWLGILLLLIFAFQLRWFPAYSGVVEAHNIIEGIVMTFRNLMLPSATLATSYMALTARTTRSSVIETLSRDYIITARAKGLSERRVLIHHALRNSLLPVASLLFINIGYMFGGAVLTETVFGWPGIGTMLVDAVATRDYPVLTGSFIIISLAVLLINFITDILYCVIDPRVRYR